MIGRVPGQRFVAEPQHLRLVGHVAGVTGDRGPVGRTRKGQRRSLRYRFCVHVARRD